MPRHLEQPLADNNYLEQLIRRSRERSNVLGDLCRFEMEGVEIEPAELFDMLKKHKLEKWSPVPIRRKTAARKAITRIKPLLEDPDNDLKIIVRPVKTHEANVTRYAIIDEVTDQQALDLDFSTRNQVVFRSDTGTIEFTQDNVPEIIDMFNHLCSVYTDAEISHMVKNVVDVHGCIWMRDNSGMFFMGHPQKKVVDSLLAIFDELRPLTDRYCYFRPIGILDDAQNRAVMGEALITDIKMALNDATESLDQSIKSSSKRGLEGSIKRFQVAQAKAQLYKDMLEININDITKQVQEANQKASAALTELALAKDDKGNDDTPTGGTEDSDDDTA